MLLFFTRISFLQNYLLLIKKYCYFTIQKYVILNSTNSEGYRDVRTVPTKTLPKTKMLIFGNDFVDCLSKFADNQPC